MTEMIAHVSVGAVTTCKLQGLPRHLPRKKQRAPLAALLGVTLANTLDLKGRVMQAKWQARQLDSNGLALAFDELGEDLDLLSDLIGQRMVGLGHSPKALPSDVTRLSRLPTFKDAILWDSQLVEAVSRCVDATRHYLEPTISAAMEAGDPATGDVLQRLKRRLLRL